MIIKYSLFCLFLFSCSQVRNHTESIIIKNDGYFLYIEKDSVDKKYPYTISKFNFKNDNSVIMVAKLGVDFRIILDKKIIKNDLYFMQLIKLYGNINHDGKNYKVKAFIFPEDFYSALRQIE